MVTVKNNDIVMTRGDSLNLKVVLVKNKTLNSGTSEKPKKLPDSREILKPEDLSGCQLFFNLSRFFPGQVKYKLWIKDKEISTETLALILDPSDTKNIPLGIYNYDIKLVDPRAHNENPQEAIKIDTFISGTFQLVGECNGEEGIINDYIHPDATDRDEDDELDIGEDGE